MFLDIIIIFGIINFDHILKWSQILKFWFYGLLYIQSYITKFYEGISSIWLTIFKLWLWMYNNPKNSKTQNLTLIQDMVKFNGPTKLQLCLKISKEKYFIHLTLYNFIFQLDKKFVNFRFFWNTLSPTLTKNTSLAVNTLTTNKACHMI